MQRCRAGAEVVLRGRCAYSEVVQMFRGGPEMVQRWCRGCPGAGAEVVLSCRVERCRCTKVVQEQVLRWCRGAEVQRCRYNKEVV